MINAPSLAIVPQFVGTELKLSASQSTCYGICCLLVQIKAKPFKR